MGSQFRWVDKNGGRERTSVSWQKEAGSETCCLPAAVGAARAAYHVPGTGRNGRRRRPSAAVVARRRVCESSCCASVQINDQDGSKDLNEYRYR